MAGCSATDSTPQAAPTTSAPQTTAAYVSSASKPGNRIYFLKDNQTAAIAYLTTLEQQSAPLVYDDRLLAVHRGGEICRDLDKGISFDSLVSSWTHMLTESGARMYVRAAVKHLCQDNQAKVPA
ncbi:DUF732 domain-containing protein [Nocardia sp. NPDC051570]|uniref:DUF732 domain-containing protein n=1 Tax=Nocardia sp. NPDC051570 TaxID=3364324 RepID=UPI0037B0FF5E